METGTLDIKINRNEVLFCFVEINNYVSSLIDLIPDNEIDEAVVLQEGIIYEQNKVIESMRKEK